MGDISSLDTLIDKYSHSNDNLNVSFGVRPSGVIHLGNLSSLALAAGTTNQIGPHNSHLNITICDLDLPYKTDWDIHKNGYVKHYRDLDFPESEKKMVDFSRESIEGFLKKLQTAVPLSYDIRTLTEVQRDPNFRKGLKKVLDNPDMRLLINPDFPQDHIDVYPLCGLCGTSYTGTKKGLQNSYKDGIITSFCTNPDCDNYNKSYGVDVEDTSVDLSVHFFIDPLRDSTVEPFADIHVFGGDYRKEHGSNKISGIEKIRQVVSYAGEGRCPDFLVGPVVYAKDGEKMSKRLNNGLDVERLMSYFGKDYPLRVFDFVMGMVEKGYHHIDYASVTEGLLSKK